MTVVVCAEWICVYEQAPSPNPLITQAFGQRPLPAVLMSVVVVFFRGCRILRPYPNMRLRKSLGFYVRLPATSTLGLRFLSRTFFCIIGKGLQPLTVVVCAEWICVYEQAPSPNPLITQAFGQRPLPAVLMSVVVVFFRGCRILRPYPNMRLRKSLGFYVRLPATSTLGLRFLSRTFFCIIGKGLQPLTVVVCAEWICVYEQAPSPHQNRYNLNNIGLWRKKYFELVLVVCEILCTFVWLIPHLE